MTQSRNRTRYAGKIRSWKAEGGFGFIAPNGGGPDVFVHIRSFARRGATPSPNDLVSYYVSTNEKGQPRAEEVAFVDERPAAQDAGRTGGFGIVAAAGFLAMLAALVAANKLLLLVLGLYCGLSLVTFIAYAMDKSAAQRGAWRTSESKLHLLALAGGWPGAAIAQQLLRHKSKKQAFRNRYWMTVVLNCAALGWALSPAGASTLGALLGSPSV